MSLKHAVLALVAERRGYGYELTQRFEERVGPGWQLNPSAVYPALDQLERSGLVVGGVRRGGARSPRVVYAATPAGAAALADWLDGAEPHVEPIRAQLHLKLAFGGPQHRPALARQLEAEERARIRLLARCAGAHDTGTPRALIDAAVAARLRAELAWLERVGAATRLR